MYEEHYDQYYCSEKERQCSVSVNVYSILDILQYIYWKGWVIKWCFNESLRAKALLHIWHLCIVVAHVRKWLIYDLTLLKMRLHCLHGFVAYLHCSWCFLQLTMLLNGLLQIVHVALVHCWLSMFVFTVLFRVSCDFRIYGRFNGLIDVLIDGEAGNWFNACVCWSFFFLFVFLGEVDISMLSWWSVCSDVEWCFYSI